jgi:Arylsulfotransferase (ASST)
MLSRRRLLQSVVSLSVLGGCTAETSKVRSLGASPTRLPTELVAPPVPVGAQSFVSRPDLKPPKITLTGSDAFSSLSEAPGYFFLAPRSSGATLPNGAVAGPMILDVKGDLIWFHPSDVPPIFNFTPQTYHGAPVLTWWSGRTGPTYGQGTYTVLDSSYRLIAHVSGVEGLKGDLHEFVITPQDTALFTAYEATHAEGQLVVQGVACEVDVATNDVVLTWRSLDPSHVGLSESFVARPAKATDLWDYFHINSIDLWPGPERDLLISARNTCAVYLVSRRTGDITWRLGGKRSDFQMSDLTRFWWQHDARALSDGSGVSLFDDASDPVERAKGDPQSRAIVLSFGPGDGGVSLSHQCIHSDTPSSQNEAAFMGNTQLLPAGGYFVGWGGGMPYFSGFDPPGDALEAPLILDGRLPSGCFSYRSYAADWTGDPPVNELALVVRPSKSTCDRWDAYVSWNGATEVASWRLQAGTLPGSPSTSSLVPRTGFETSATLTVGGSAQKPPSFQAQALDRSGKLLGESAIVLPSGM